ncbi:MAG: TonB family protein [Armatimonadota bacterium]
MFRCFATEKTLTWAFGISLAVHILTIGIIGRTSILNLSASRTPKAPRFIRVELMSLSPKHPVQTHKQHLEKPPTHNYFKQASVQSQSDTGNSFRHTSISYRQSGFNNVNRTENPTAYASSNPGGKLNIGSTSSAGDLPGDWQEGKTPIGWVPDPYSSGQGSGHAPGVGSQEPPRKEELETKVHSPPVSPPEPSPKPSTVSVRVCSNSGLLPGPNCRDTEVRTFISGRQPTDVCSKCQPPHKSRLADRSEPQLAKDSHINIPSSVPEGLTLRIEIQYTVTADGDVTDVTVLKPSGYKALDNAVISAAYQMKYKPAVQDGIPRSVKRIRTYTINT